MSLGQPSGVTDEREGDPGHAVTWLCWLGIVALYLLLRVSLLDIPLDRDEGAFALIGLGILDGQVPYRDVFDHKPPGAFYINALALSVFSASARGIHLFLHLWNFATLLLVASTARVLAGKRAALWAAFAYAVISITPSVQGSSASTETLLLLPMMASIRLTLASLRRESWRGARLLLAAGACGAAACWIKQPAVLPLLSVPILLFDHHGTRRPKPALAAFAWWLAGGLTVTAAVCACFVIAGIFGEFYYWSFVHSAAYGTLSWSHAAQYLLARGLPYLLDNGFLAGLTIVGLLVAAWRRLGHAWTLLCLLVLSAMSVAHAGYFYAHYFQLLSPALALGAAYTLDKLLSHGWLATPLHRSAIIATVIPVATLLPVWWSPWYYGRPDPVQVSIMLTGPQAFEAAPEIASYLRERMPPDAWMFIYGSEPQIPLLSGRRNANPYVNTYPLTAGVAREREFQRRTWEMIEETKPTYLVFVLTRRSNIRRPGTSPWLEEQLARLRQDAFVLDTTLYATSEQGLTLGLPPEAPPADPENRPTVLYEFWVRRGAF